LKKMNQETIIHLEVRLEKKIKTEVVLHWNKSIKKVTLLRYKHQNYQVVHQGTWLVVLYLKIATELLVLSLVDKKRIPLC
jgi:hypothetical protein